MKGLLIVGIIVTVLSGNALAWSWPWSWSGKSTENDLKVECLDGDLSPHQNCSLYYQCSNNELVILSCSLGTVFNPRTELCDFPSQVPECVGGTRPPEDGTTEKNPGETTEAVTSEPEPGTTEGPTDGPRSTDQHVTNPEDASTTDAAEDRTTDAGGKTTELEEQRTSTDAVTEEEMTTEDNDVSPGPSTESPLCINDGIYTIPVPGNCSIYILCTHYVPTEQICPPNLLYDPELGACNLADLVEECKAPLCEPNDVGIKPVPGNCSQFVICADGEELIRTCPPGTLFDPEFGQCNVAEEVDCKDRDLPTAQNNRESNPFQVEYERITGFLEYGHRFRKALANSPNKITA